MVIPIAIAIPLAPTLVLPPTVLIVSMRLAMWPAIPIDLLHHCGCGVVLHHCRRCAGGSRHTGQCQRAKYRTHVAPAAKRRFKRPEQAWVCSIFRGVIARLGGRRPAGVEPLFALAIRLAVLAVSEPPCTVRPD